MIRLETRTISARFFEPAHQAKPWGHELLFADGASGYVGKVITVHAGHSLSLQYHCDKHETMFVISGTGLMVTGETPDRLTARPVEAGDAIHVPAGALHRMTAVTDLVFVEASTARPGWREDVVRLEDGYGREGTSAP